MNTPANRRTRSLPILASSTTEHRARLRPSPRWCSTPHRLRHHRHRRRRQEDHRQEGQAHRTHRAHPDQKGRAGQAQDHPAKAQAPRGAKDRRRGAQDRPSKSKLPDIPKPVEVKMDAPKPIITPPAPKMVIAQAAPKDRRSRPSQRPGPRQQLASSRRGRAGQPQQSSLPAHRCRTGQSRPRQQRRRRHAVLQHRRGTSHRRQPRRQRQPRRRQPRHRRAGRSGHQARRRRWHWSGNRTRRPGQPRPGSPAAHAQTGWAYLRGPSAPRPRSSPSRSRSTPPRQFRPTSRVSSPCTSKCCPTARWKSSASPTVSAMASTSPPSAPSWHQI